MLINVVPYTMFKILILTTFILYRMGKKNYFDFFMNLIFMLWCLLACHRKSTYKATRHIVTLYEVKLICTVIIMLQAFNIEKMNILIYIIFLYYMQNNIQLCIQM